MVLKGCTKKVIVVQDEPNGVFEQAVFFVKPDCHSFAEGDFVKEAARFISSRTVCGEQVNLYQPAIRGKRALEKQKKLWCFLLGLITGVVVSFLIFAI